MIQQINQQPKIATGISGLDYILGGGLPANHLYLVEGSPGTGKTTLALQFLLAGHRRGEKGLYVTLSETKDELRTVAESHGLSLDGIHLFELESIEERLHTEEQYTVFHPSEVELSETTRRICEQVEAIQPALVVFDSLSELRLLAREPLRYRRQVLALKQFFAGRKCTVILLDDRTSSEADLQLQSICHGVIVLNRVSVSYGGARRRLSVAKMRGLQFMEGNHDFSILPGGLVVYPRLVSAQHRLLSTQEHTRTPISSGIPELDMMLNGGIHPGTSTLILGPAGTGKSTLITQYALSMALGKKRVACYAFEETEENFMKRALESGLDVRSHIAEGTITITKIDPSEMSPGEFAHKIRMAVEKDRVEAVIVDSLNGYLHAMPDETYLLLQLHELLTYLNEHGVLTLLVLAQHGLLGKMDSPVDVTYLADTVIMLRYFEAFGKVRQALAVMKKRTGSHERAIREYEFTSGGIRVGEPLHDFEGVLTGVPVYRGSREALLDTVQD